MAKSAALSSGISSPSLIGLPLEVQSMILGYVGQSTFGSLTLKMLLRHLLLAQLSLITISTVLFTFLRAIPPDQT